MKTRTLTKTSVFPADRHTVFGMLRRLDTLQRIARPYMFFAPAEKSRGAVWEEGKTSSYRLRLFGIIPLGTHTIRVIRFSESGGICTREGNRHVPVWNHEIELKALPGGKCEYTDRVEIGAGWKTPFVFWWAKRFYSHRQRRWIRILAGKKPD